MALEKLIVIVICINSKYCESSHKFIINRARNEKINNYAPQLRLGSINFAPAVVSVMGYEDKSFTNFIDYCHDLAKSHGTHFPLKFYLGRVSHLLATHIGIRTAKCFQNHSCRAN